MKILLVSHYGDAADWLFRMSLEDGNKVQLYIEDAKSQEVFDGLLPKCKDWRRGVQWADLILWDDNKCDPAIWKYAHALKKPCIGGSPFAKRLEDDRAYAHKLMELAGIPRVESLTFKTFPEVIKHLKADKKAHVIKPQGDKVKSHHLIVGEDDDGSDAIDEVERLIEAKLPVTAIEVEERKRGVECAITIFFNGYEAVGPYLLNFEHKHSHNGEKGFLTGEQGTLARYVADTDLPLYKETIAKFLPTLRTAGYVGIIDINCIVGRNRESGEIEISPLEFTPRPGKPTIFLMDELMVSPWGETMLAIAKGGKPDIQVHYDWVVGVLKCAFGFPFEDQATEISKGLAIRGLDEDSLAHIHPMEVRLDGKGKFVHAGGEGYVLVSTGKGETVSSAKSRAYDVLSRIRMKNSFHRDDITDKIHLFELEDLGILPQEEAGV